MIYAVCRTRSRSLYVRSTFYTRVVTHHYVTPHHAHTLARTLPLLLPYAFSFLVLPHVLLLPLPAYRTPLHTTFYTHIGLDPTRLLHVHTCVWRSPPYRYVTFVLVGRGVACLGLPAFLRLLRLLDLRYGSLYLVFVLYTTPSRTWTSLTHVAALFAHCRLLTRSCIHYPRGFRYRLRIHTHHFVYRSRWVLIRVTTR